jgi:putative DNA primase/helicase
MVSFTTVFGTGGFTASGIDHQASSGDVLSAFLAAMDAAGVSPLESIAAKLIGGKLVRFRADGDGPGRANGWARLYLDAPATGIFGSWRLAIREAWRCDSGAPSSHDERRRQAALLRDLRDHQALVTAQKHQKAASEAGRQWEAGSEISTNEHGYLRAKAMSGEGLRVANTMLLVPMQDEAGHLWNLQRIAPDGAKRFLAGGKTHGLFWMPVPPVDRVCVGEGVATMAAVRKMTGYPVVAALSAKNLEPVARVIRQRWPDLDIIICGDDDCARTPNIGRDAAYAAALAVGGRIALPPMETRS